VRGRARRAAPMPRNVVVTARADPSVIVSRRGTQSAGH